MRTRAILFILAAALLGCGEPGHEPPESAGSAFAGLDEPIADSDDLVALGRAFVRDGATRRLLLEASLVAPERGYGALRLANYARRDGAWDNLPLYNPPVRPLTVDDVGELADNPYRLRDLPRAPVFDAERFGWTHDELLALGREAFERYPLQSDMKTGAYSQSEAQIARAGLWVDDRGHVGGLVRVEAGASARYAKTCATCHASPRSRGAALVRGRSNAEFDHGLTWGGLDWGPGRVDVTSDGVYNPTAITDLRPIRHQRRLHWAATLENSLGALAVRVDTLIITSHGQDRRPPRELSFALAYYLWHLDEGEATERELRPAEQRGSQHFALQCSGCHHSDGSTAPPQPVSRIGTEPSVAQSPDRGVDQGVYRVPSLRGVADRSQFFHHGRVRSLDDLLDPQRLERVEGHPFGTQLTDEERLELIAFLRTL